MGRHGKNATASAVYSYHERRKDTVEGQYGSQSMRLGKDSIKDFDCCSLTLQPCKNPVVTVDGYLYDKEAILECLLHQKRENARRLKEYERQKQRHEEKEFEQGREETHSMVAKFLSTEKSIVSKPINPFTGETTDSKSHDKTSKGQSTTDSGSAEDQRSKLPSFWIPSLTPDAKPTEIKKPDNKTYCPTSGRQLRVKDLVPVKFTPIADRDKKTSTIFKQARYMCPVTHDVLGNSIPCAVLRPSGEVVTMECVEKLIRTSDMMCPLTGKKLKESDIIQLDRGGTGYAASGVTLKAKIAGAAMMA
uniref:Nitric oxide synthase-interacting protein n=1 Tax=Suberites domuncula TaxID=55567 RepID=X5J5Z3_SUBDO|nr:nitric oxide synthase-interacting protein [Suberites domuncula]